MTTIGRLAAWTALVLVVYAAALVPGCKGGDEVYDTEIVVNTAPQQGAELKLNGQVYGVTPRPVRGLPPGPVFVDVSLAGFKRAYDTYKVPESGSATFTITMERMVGDVTIQSEPTRAAVYLKDGTPLGVTPITGLKLPEGIHEIEVRHEKYEPLTEKIVVRADYKYSKLFTLKARESRIEVFSTPSSANIYLNNALQNEKTPARIPITPGTYTVGVYKGGYIMEEVVVNVEPASDANVSVILKEGEVPMGMVLVPGGDFIMGTDDKSPDERPKRTLNIESFYIDKYEVTNAQFKEVFASHTFPKGQEEYPVLDVTWEEATAYAKQVGKRLPTEEEWEKAARGTDGREYPWGDLWNPELANVNAGQLNPKALPVGKLIGGASPYGCMDMAGNAYEWTSSWYQRYKGNEDIVKEYGQVFRVLRGGSFRKDPFDARCVRRSYDLNTNRREDYGFRCAADVAPPGGPPRR
ncbi:MAG: SUMF1/EgtB/PvdO family nonheme iron enzyme [Candidatus Hydrogenedentes bacterium]|nr:SUMF1/EgtB/PvdO family nonheme iron enzyme [Candidatus Hydrogenedentota bacterium]